MEEIDMTADAAQVLREGSHDPWVRYLKQLLEHLGEEPGSINETFDSATRRAVVSFQSKWNHLPETGVADPATWAWLITRAADHEFLDSLHADKEVGSKEKLDPGAQIGRAGWCNLHFQCTFVDHFGRPFPDCRAYVRFEDTAHDRDASDEDGTINDGALVLPDIWVPRTGLIHIYVNSPQLDRSGRVGWVEGIANLHNESRTSIAFTATQNLGEQATWTYEEIEAWATSHDHSYSAGASVIFEGSTSAGQQITHEAGAAVGTAITLTFPGTGFELRPHR